MSGEGAVITADTLGPLGAAWGDFPRSRYPRYETAGRVCCADLELERDAILVLPTGTLAMPVGDMLLLCLAMERTPLTLDDLVDELELEDALNRRVATGIRDGVALLRGVPLSCVVDCGAIGSASCGWEFE